MNVAIFVRVSTKKQDYKRQVSDLKEYCEHQGYNIIDIITEKISGAKKNSQRPAIQALYKLVESGKIKKVIVSEVSRLGRKTVEVLKVVEKLTELGVSIYIQNYNLETLTPKGKRNPMASLMFTMLAEFAQMERETTIERINSGLEEAKRKGKTLGRPQGTTLDKDDLLKKYSKVLKCLENGLSIRKTMAECKVSINTVQKVKRVIVNYNQKI